MATLITKLKGLLTPRDTLVRRLSDLEAQHAAAGQARAQAIAAAEVERAKIMEILLHPERLRVEAMALGSSARAEEAHLENQLREAPPPDLAKFTGLLDRLFTRLRALAPPMAIEQYDAIADVRRVTNLAEIERHLALAPALAQIRAEAAGLWRLESAALTERLAGLRHALDAALEGTLLEDEAA